MSTTNVNILSQDEWRQIHNALSNEQCRTTWNKGQHTFLHTLTFRRQLQGLMDKVRDNYIDPSDV